MAICIVVIHVELSSIERYVIIQLSVQVEAAGMEENGHGIFAENAMWKQASVLEEIESGLFVLDVTIVLRD